MGERKKSLVIRGHHLKNVAPYLRDPNLDPAEESKKTGDELRANIALFDNWLAHPGMISSPRLAYAKREAEYARDVLGPAYHTSRRFETAFSEFIGTLQDLPPDHPIELTAGEKDGICSSCVIGKHCRSINGGHR